MSTAGQAGSQQRAAATTASTAAGTASSGTASNGDGYRPLNVKDALSYLDQVKNQFTRNPGIYNRFLDIMKDFKTQNIDTPGVIDRVSTLFQGHPTLIQGFNTFLPPGFRIDCSMDPAEAGLITVTTPTGVTRRDLRSVNAHMPPAPATNGPHLGGSSNWWQQSVAAASAAAANANPGGNASSAQRGTPTPLGGGVNVSAAIPSHPVVGNARTQAGSVPSAAQSTTTQSSLNAARRPAPGTTAAASTSASSGALNQATTTRADATASSHPGAGSRPGSNNAIPSHVSTGTAVRSASAAPVTGTAGSATGTPTGTAGSNTAGTGAPSNASNIAQRQPAEFNHAINFVNKIKHRFNRRPDTYKAFLEILQTYQKEQRAIQDVYAQVTILFQDAPDLLEEFKEFLPDNSNSQESGAPDGTAAAGSVGQGPTQASVATPHTAPHATTQTMASQPANRNARIGSTTSLFGVGPMVGPSGTTQAQHSALQGQHAQAHHQHGPASSAHHPAASRVEQSQPYSRAAPHRPAGASTARQVKQRDGRLPANHIQPYRGAWMQPTDFPEELSDEEERAAAYAAHARQAVREKEAAAAAAAASRRTSGIPGSSAYTDREQGHNQHSTTQGMTQQGYYNQQPSSSQHQFQEKYADEEWQPPSGRSKKRQNTGQSVASAQDKARAKKGKLGHAGQDDEMEDLVAAPLHPGMNGYSNGIPVNASGALPGAGSAAANGQQLLAPQPFLQPVTLPAFPRPHGPRGQAQPLVTTDEFVLFDRIKKYIDDKPTYHEFLKMLNMFVQELLDMPTLLEKAFLYIGGSDEIFGSFREFVGEQDGFVPGEEWPIDNAPALDRERVELSALKSYGPSYRKLPYGEAKGLACSGRDALCWSVLNDDWVAFATWASEGSGAHRKNPYEDALASSEQERHWYDYNIDSNIRSIALLEPIVARISLMSAEERSTFRLKPGLGGPSSSFYERTIKKIYGKDQGVEALGALYETPAIAAPIILARLKQKDEEWRKALREWNRVWRDVDAKNFYRSLDHQGMTFKANDKKTITSKHLLSEIETLKREAQQKRIAVRSEKDNPDDIMISETSLRPSHQFEMQMDDTSVIFDVMKLILSFLDRATPSHTSKDRASIEATLRRLVPLLFNIDETDVESNIAPAIVFDQDAAEVVENGVESEQEDAIGALSDAGGGSASDSSVPLAGKKGGAKRDLRKKLLTSAAANGAKGDDGKGDTATDGEQEKPDTGLPSLEEATWIPIGPVPYPAPVSEEVPKTTQKQTALPSPDRGDASPSAQQQGDLSQSTGGRYVFFGHQGFYSFMRLFHLLYHRLATLKQLAADLAASNPPARLSPFAVKLGITTPVPHIDEEGVPRGSTFYEYMLEMCEKFFDGEVDVHTFEEHLRYMWGIKAYPFFTVGIVISSIIKHIHSLNHDARAHQLIDLLTAERQQPRTSARGQMVYRHACEEIIGLEENLFRIEWIPSAKSMTIQLLGPDDPTIETANDNVASQWANYVDAYALDQPTEGLDHEVQAPLLARNRRILTSQTEAEQSRIQGCSTLAIRISGSHRISYLKGTEEVIYRATLGEPNEEKAIQARTQRKEAWEEWLQSADEADPVAENIDEDNIVEDAISGQDDAAGKTVAIPDSEVEGAGSASVPAQLIIEEGAAIQPAVADNGPDQAEDTGVRRVDPESDDMDMSP